MNLTNEFVIEKAKQIGFDLVGFANVEQLNNETEKFNEWLELGYHADMIYMSRNLEKRNDVKKILRSAESVISLGLNYNTDESHSQIKFKGKISRYAWGKDYHLVIWENLNELENQLKEVDPGFESKSYWMTYHSKWLKDTELYSWQDNPSIKLYK